MLRFAGLRRLVLRRRRRRLLRRRPLFSASRAPPACASREAAAPAPMIFSSSRACAPRSRSSSALEIVRALERRLEVVARRHPPPTRPACASSGRPHVGPHLFDVVEALGLGAALARRLPAERPARARPARFEYCSRDSPPLDRRCRPRGRSLTARSYSSVEISPRPPRSARRRTARGVTSVRLQSRSVKRAASHRRARGDQPRRLAGASATSKLSSGRYSPSPVALMNASCPPSRERTPPRAARPRPPPAPPARAAKKNARTPRDDRSRRG